VMNTFTRTYAELEVSDSTFEEIFSKLKEANYEHAFVAGAEGKTTKIDMHGIALTRKKTEAVCDCDHNDSFCPHM